MAKQRRYLAYMLRLWRVDANGEAVWRASLEDPHTGERRGFASLDRLFELLEEEMHDPTDHDSLCRASANSDESIAGQKE